MEDMPEKIAEKLLPDAPNPKKLTEEDIATLEKIVSLMDPELIPELDPEIEPGPIEEGDYILRFGEPGSNVVLMGDLGLTWEPLRPYPTPFWGAISLEWDVEKTAAILTEVGKWWNSVE